MRIAQTDDLPTCHALRRAVFIDEQGIAEADEWDDLDAQAVHLLAYVNDTPLGTARLRQVGKEGRIGRVCVLSQARGTGLGAALVRFGVDWFTGQPGVSSVVLGAQCHAQPFYEKLGFAAFGPVYDDAGIPHQDMRAQV
ncbi:GNAT family N-acetyltransferase [Antarctobacter sp.]|uniref:GNAT family N-acetyltransferase n=1 Tax=Antarctobacter sp. TaxID=1872577 RepID=UPI003A8EDA03